MSRQIRSLCCEGGEIRRSSCSFGVETHSFLPPHFQAPGKALTFQIWPVNQAIADYCPCEAVAYLTPNQFEHL